MICKAKLRMGRRLKLASRNSTVIQYATIIVGMLLLSACEQPTYPYQESIEPAKPTKYISYLQSGQQAEGILVKFKSNAGAASRSRSLAAAGLKPQGNGFQLVPGLTLSTVNSGLSINEALSNLSNDPTVAYAEPDYTLYASAIPNDSMFSQQWGLNNANNNDINGPEAWDVAQGDKNIVIAVIDSGVDYTHPDLQGQIWSNPGEIPNNNRDDDGNGFVDDIRGWDFGAGDNNPMDENDHGTHVAGIIGANSNNNRGVTGINWNVQIMPLKFMNAQGQGSTSAAIRALNYAVANGARVSNNSWGGGAFSQALFDAIQAANRQNHIFVAAAGNDGVNTDSGNNFPSTYDLPNIISVAASDQSDRLTNFSNFGVRSVDLAAPGAQIMSTVRNGGYRSMSGTSMAAPFVTGVAGLVLSQNPNLSAAEIKAALLDNVDPVSSLSGRILTGGRLNALKAVNGVPSTVPPPTTTTPVEITPPALNQLMIGDTLQLSATGGDGVYSWRSSNTAVATINNSGMLTAQNAGTTRVTASDGNGLLSTAVTITVNTQAVNNLIISPANISQINLNENIQLNASGGVAPYSWQSNNPSVADITVGTTNSQIANINPNAAGSFRVTATDANGNTAQTGLITVNASSPLIITAAQTSINIAQTLQLSISGGTSPYTWRSSRPSIIAVGSGGLVEGLAEGSSSISVTDSAGNTTSVNIQVINTATGNLLLTPDTNIFGIHSRTVIKATGGGRQITWSSTNPAVASIDNRGVVTANAVGIAEIQAVDEAGRTGTASFEVRTISITGSVLTIGAGDTLQLTADGGAAPYQWSVSNSSLASIDSNGLLTSKAGAFGGILVTATDTDGISKSIIITINDATSFRAPRSQ